MKLKSLLLVLVLSTLAVAQDKVVGGPYAVNVTGRSATVGWIVETGQVKAGPDQEKLDRAAPVLRSEKVTFTGLPPGQMIHYDVLNGRKEGKGFFRTPPPAGTEATFEALIFGDTRTRHDMHRKVIEAVLKFADPHLTIHTGDLVADGADTAQWPVFFDVEGDLLRRAAFFPVLGNHERNNYKYYDYFEVTSPYYSLDWGQVHFTFLNTDLGNFSPSMAERERFWEDQKRWLIDDLTRAQKAQFRVVVMHHPPFTGVGRRQGGGGNVWARTLVPVFEQFKVHFVFTGHDHNYQRHEFGGVQYIVTGGGGAPLYPADSPIEGLTRKMISTEHFVRLLISPGMAKVQAVGIDGTVHDKFEVAAK